MSIIKSQQLIFTLTIFISAYLLFLIQPMVGKVLLPNLGGNPSVWNTAMVFFQVLLLLGYLYAHLLGKIKQVRYQVAIHGTILFLALLSLPMSVNISEPSGSPFLWQIGTMAIMIGLPFFALSTSAPLLQKWFSVSDHPNADRPYFLYSASNIGSVLALLAYPIIVERFMPLQEQTIGFQIAFAVLVLSLILCGATVWKRNLNQQVYDEADAKTPSLKTIGLWLLLAFVPSSMMLGYISFVTTDIGSAPLFWVVPLALYILSFVFAFATKKIIPMGVIYVGFIVMFVAANCIGNWITIKYLLEVGIAHTILFFLAAMLCHQKLDALKPHPKHLTLFFLIMSLGGALGGIFNSLIAPLIFVKPYEYMITSVLALICWSMGSQNRMLFVPVVVLFMLMKPIVPWENEGYKILHVSRNYFGTLTVRDDGITRGLTHGTTQHGSQAVAEELRLKPITYYYQKTALVETLRIVKDFKPKLNATVLGLGVGVMSCHMRPNDNLTFYEIDPDVITLAKDSSLFTFISDCKTNVSIIEGDARLKLREAEAKSFDYILVDAFSGDNIPLHMITLNATEMYLDKLKSDGLLVFHVSNRYMALEEELALIADKLNIGVFRKKSEGGDIPNTNIKYYPTIVTVMTNNPEYQSELVKNGWEKMDMSDSTLKPWTDDFANPIRAILRK
jgi:hypothetical protein